MLSDLNSVLLEGEIVKTLPLEKDRLPDKVELRTIRVHGETSTEAYFVVDVKNNAPVLREELGIGRKIRVIGRLVNIKRKAVLLQAEHIELKPGYRKPLAVSA